MNIDLINYRREKAKETLADVKLMFGQVSLFTTVNRIYYSVFYIVLALLLTKNLYSSKHSGVRSIFNKEFIKTGIIKEEFGKFFNTIFEFRQKGDYGDFIEFEKDKVEVWLKEAESLVAAMDKIIEKQIK
jgi:uncharacterized protein (UPF0332 family)